MRRAVVELDTAEEWQGVWEVEVEEGKEGDA